jgi:hypothetical protein
LHNWSAMESVMDLSELEFAGTIWELINRGRVAPLIAYIRSDKALRPEDRGYLADYLEGKLKRKRGRPIGGLESQKIKFLAGLVRAAKAQLRERGERYRIHNKTIDLVLDVYSVSGKPPVDREKLENYLRRSQRKPRKK